MPISSALIHSTKFGWSNIDGCTCFDNQGCQQGSETGIRLSWIYPARQRGRTLRWPSDASLMGVANWVTVNLQKFSPRKTIFKQFAKVFTAKETRYTVTPKTGWGKGLRKHAQFGCLLLHVLNYISHHSNFSTNPQNTQHSGLPTPKESMWFSNHTRWHSSTSPHSDGFLVHCNIWVL